MLKTTHGCSAILEYTRIQDRSSRVDFCTCKERNGREKAQQQIMSYNPAYPSSDRG
jgi:hypothetical protein